MIIYSPNKIQLSDLQKFQSLNDLTNTNCKANFVNLKSVDYENEFQCAYLSKKAKELH